MAENSGGSAKTVLVTGGFGFLGRNVARQFKAKGYTVYGIGHGNWSLSEAKKMGFDHWVGAEVTVQALRDLSIKPSLVIHASGSGSVAHSFSKPHLDFQKTVDSTAAVLEFLREYSPTSKLIYPSSPAVQGAHPAVPIRESDPIEPVSPYGIHKWMSEILCSSYRKNYQLDITIIRFFSIYGEGLQKQLLWDAAQKFFQNNDEVQFWGTGQEIRDWIHIDDAIELIEQVSKMPVAPLLLNGGSGLGHSVQDVLTRLSSSLGLNKKMVFCGDKKEGDPNYYVADLTELKKINWSAKISLDVGLRRYSKWFIEAHKK